jgi:lysozyme family protein
MRDMHRDTALAIYHERFILAPKLDQIALIDPPIAAHMLDAGINCGPAVPVRFLQRALAVLSNEGRLFLAPTPDGNVGKITLAAMQAFVAQRRDNGRRVLLNMVRAQQSVRYVELAEASPSQQTYEWGWQLNRAW